jgi:soluble cytochrome b562
MSRTKNTRPVEIEHLSALQDISDSIAEEVRFVADDSEEMRSFVCGMTHHLSRLDDIIGILLEGRELP